MGSFKSVDEYIAAQPAAAQTRLRALRKIVKEVAPKAEEKLSYGIPYYSLGGRLVYFAAFKNHIGFYPMKAAIRNFQKELAGYETAPGTVRFPLDKPLPLPLIRRIITFRTKENLAQKK